ncbi:MAG: hypothetical protein AAB909_00435, partial [Patescibacteria group bacterium]
MFLQFLLVEKGSVWTPAVANRPRCKCGPVEKPEPDCPGCPPEYPIVCPSPTASPRVTIEP